MSPFEEFFRKEWPERLREVEIPRDQMQQPEGVPGTSWDRRAAWLLWVAEKRDRI